MGYCVGDGSVMWIHQAVYAGNKFVDWLGTVGIGRRFVDWLGSEGGCGWGDEHWGRGWVVVEGRGLVPDLFSWGCWVEQGGRGWLYFGVDSVYNLWSLEVVKFFLAFIFVEVHLVHVVGCDEVCSLLGLLRVLRDKHVLAWCWLKRGKRLRLGQ